METMNTIEMNNDYRYDVDLSQANVKVNENNLFSTKEKSSVDALNKVLSTTIELKSCDNAKYNLFIEYNCTKRDNITYDSGIASTEADIWRVNVGELVFEFPTHFLKWIYKNREVLEIKESPIINKTDLAVMGMLLPVGDILPLYTKYKLTKDFLEKRLKDLGFRK
jgi:hypothetical protein